MRVMMMKKILAASMAAAMLVTSAPVAGLAEPVSNVGAAETGENPLRMWYDEPATDWQQQTLPIGNGDMGANIYGGVAQEHLTFNEKTLWTGGPSTLRPNYNGGNLENVGRNGALVKEIQQLFQEGKDAQATQKCASLVGDGAQGEYHSSLGYGAYQPWGDIYFDYQGVTAGSASGYARDLDLNTAISTVSFEEGGTAYTREYFISNPDNVLVAKLSAKGGKKLNLDVRFTSQHGATAKASGESLVVAGALTDNQMKYDSVLKVVKDGGSVTANGSKLEVRDADSITVFLSAATDYKNEYPEYRTGETAEALHKKVADAVDNAAVKGYDAVKAAHVKDYQGLYSRMALDLNPVVSDKTTDELLTAYNAGTASEGERRQLEMILFQYGRYLTIASSRENSQLPSNLQGVWNNSTTPAWHADYHMNVNLQMNYWPTYVTNLAECADPLIRYVDSLREPGRVTAKIYAGVESTAENPENGFMAHTQNTPFGWTCPGWAFSWGWSPAAVPWILQNCWEYYDFTRDETYMEKNIYPMMKEEATLYDQILVEDENGKLVSSPSYSPEHGPYTSGNTYEQSLVWQLYEDTIAAAKILGKDEAKIKTWTENQKNLKGPIEIGTDGQIKEWYTETSLGSVGGEGYGHRHLSHMLGLYPGDLISVETPKWLEAARVSMNNRTDSSTGWGMGQRINTWARLRDGNHAYKLITDLFRSGIYANLWDTHPPFQIDGNFGYTSGVAEMLLQSNAGYMDLLPALPDNWTQGEVTGIVARGNFDLDMSWANGQLSEVTVTSNKGNDAVMQCNGITAAKVTDENGKTVHTKTLSDNRISFSTETGKSYRITGFPEREAIPENLRIAKKDGDEVVLAWDAIPSDGAVYNVYRQTAGGKMMQIASGISGTTYTDAKAYGILGALTYQVTAGSGATESKMSLSVQRTEDCEMVDNPDGRITYKGSWGNWTQDADNYGGTVEYLETPTGTETATLSFEGTGIEVLSVKNHDRGFLEISIDDKVCDTVDTYASGTVRQSVVFSKKDLEFGNHTIVVRATNTKNSLSSRTKVEIDAFRIFKTAIKAPQLPAGSDSAVLAVEDGRVMAQWKETENAEGYNIYVGGELVDTVETPYAWIDAEKGKIYNAEIKAIVNSQEVSGGISFVIGIIPVSSVIVTESSKTINVGETYQIQASVAPANATDKGLSYTSSNPAVATADAAGKVTAIGGGSADITVASVADPTKKAVVRITVVVPVVNIAVTGVTVAESSKTLNIGETYQIQASVAPDNATNKSVTYTSSNEAVAKADAAGIVTAIGAGSADITVASVSDPTKTAVVHITVNKKKEEPKPQPVNTLITKGDLQFKVTKSTAKGGNLSVVKLTDSGKKKNKVTIPAALTKNGFTYQVTAIEDKAFANSKKLRTIIIGKNVSKIGKESFGNCSKLKSIQLKGTKAPKFGKNAFKAVKNCKVYYSKKVKLSALKNALKNTGIKKVSYKKK